LSAEGRKAASRAGNYQDAATASLDRDLDNDATTQDDSEGDQAIHAVSGRRAVEPDRSGNILSSVDKVLPYQPYHSRQLTFMITCSFAKLFALSDQVLRESNDGWIWSPYHYRHRR
jgi:hypothetical protein